MSRMLVHCLEGEQTLESEIMLRLGVVELMALTLGVVGLVILKQISKCQFNGSSCVLGREKEDPY